MACANPRSTSTTTTNTHMCMHKHAPSFLSCNNKQVAQHVLRGHLYRQPGETSDTPPTEPGIMDLMAEIKLNSDYKRASAAPVWLKGGNVLNGHHGAAGAGRWSAVLCSASLAGVCCCWPQAAVALVT